MHSSATVCTCGCQSSFEREPNSSTILVAHDRTRASATSSVSVKHTQAEGHLRTWVHEQHVNAGRLGGDLPFHLLRLVEVLDAARPARQQVVTEQHRKPSLPLGKELAQLSAVLDGLWEVEYLVEQERESH